MGVGLLVMGWAAAVARVADVVMGWTVVRGGVVGDRLGGGGENIFRV